MADILQNILIVLVNTTHPGNIGAVARAMKNMDFLHLALVNPKLFPHAEATARAAGADEVLQYATIFPNLATAVKDCHLVIGTSVRERSIPVSILDPRAAAIKSIQVASKAQKVAIVFGTENSGLTNQELELCHYQLHIPTNVEFSSLNLAAAVLLVVYELRMMLLTSAVGEDLNPLYATRSLLERKTATLATHAETEAFYTHLENVLINIKFLNPQNPRHLMTKIRRLFGRIHLEAAEVGFLRGILTASAACQVCKGAPHFENK